MPSSRFSAGRPGSIISPVSPQFLHVSQAHKDDDDSDVSPLTSPAEHNDLSSISGFPQFSGFNFDIDSEEAPLSPTGERRPSDSSTLQLIPRAVPPVIAIVTSTALPGGVHREAVAEEVVADPPPPYTRYDKPQSPTRSTPGGSWASRAARIAMITQQPSQPSPVYAGRTRQHRNQRFASAAGIGGGLTRQQTQRTLHPLTLQDLAESGYGTERMNGARSAAETGRTRGEAAVKRKGTWRGRIFCPSGGCFGLSESRGNGEKRGLTRKGKYCVVGMIIAMAIAMIIVGAVVGTQHNRTRGNKGIVRGNKDLMETVPGFPPIPTGLSTIKSQGKPEALTTCVSPPSLWSCDLPSDSRFPSTITSSGDGRVPEFKFTIKIGNDSTNQAESLWTPVPSNIPNATDYAQLGGSVDGVMSQDKAGEETPFYISLETDSSPSSDKVKIQSVNTFSSGSATILKRGYRTFRRHALLHPRQDLNKQPANMIPETLKNQPLRLFDRDLETEHYGFHIYYQKSIYVSSINSSSNNNQSEETTETPGGVLGKNANFVVNWENTRFKVTIWTKIRSTGTVDLIDENNSRRPKNDDASKGFPYAVSIWEDRTGGDPRERGILSYPVRDGSRDMTGKMGIPEKRGVNTEVRGCFCEWKNWRESM